MGEMGNTYILVGKPERKGSFGRRNRDVEGRIVLQWSL
jgi:hypothetical protein